MKCRNLSEDHWDFLFSECRDEKLFKLVYLIDMLKNERYQKILSRLELDQTITVKDMAELCSVREDCIRKDLSVLEKQGKLRRIHGGATLVCEAKNPGLYSAESRMDLHYEQKAAIARKAVELIRDKSMVFLDISTITLEIAKQIVLNDLEVTVVSNMASIIPVFRQPSKASFIMIGGKMNQAKDGFVGSLADQQISRFHFDLGFFGAVGADPGDGTVTTYEMEDALTKNCAIRHCSQKCLVFEREKLHQKGNSEYSMLEDFDFLITDHGLSNKEKLALEKYTAVKQA